MTVFDFLRVVQSRPEMFLSGESPLQQLQAQLVGYYWALHMHDLDEQVPEMYRHFNTWLRGQTGWSLSCGWAHAIEANVEPDQAPLDVFFSFVDQYELLRPVPLLRADLNESNVPTGKRCVIGFNGRMQRPDAVEIVQYQPAELFFLRFHYGSRIRNDDILEDLNSQEKTPLAFAKQWVAEELQVGSSDWRSLGQHDPESNGRD